MSMYQEMCIIFCSHQSNCRLLFISAEREKNSTTPKSSVYYCKLQTLENRLNEWIKNERNRENPGRIEYYTYEFGAIYIYFIAASDLCTEYEIVYHSLYARAKNLD